MRSASTNGPSGISHRDFPQLLRTVIGFLVFLILLVLFLQSGIRESVALERLRQLGENPLTPVLIILAMTGAWAFALPGSMFFFVTPLLFSPWESTAIITLGTAAGSTAGYAAAKWLGGPWVERSRASRWCRFLSRHSTFGMIFALRIVPGSQHGVINYSAGALSIGFIRFLAATLVAVGIKAFLYAVAIQKSIGATNIREALNTETVVSLMLLAGIGVVGHIVQRGVAKQDAATQEGEPKV